VFFIIPDAWNKSVKIYFSGYTERKEKKKMNAELLSVEFEIPMLISG